MFQLTDTNDCDRLPWLPSQLCHCVRIFLLIIKNVFYQLELTRMFQLSDTNECDRLPWLPSQLVSLCEDISSDNQKCIFPTGTY